MRINKDKKVLFLSVLLELLLEQPIFAKKQKIKKDLFCSNKNFIRTKLSLKQKL